MQEQFLASKRDRLTRIARALDTPRPCAAPRGHVTPPEPESIWPPAQRCESATSHTVNKPEPPRIAQDRSALAEPGEIEPAQVDAQPMVRLPAATHQETVATIVAPGRPPAPAARPPFRLASEVGREIGAVWDALFAPREQPMRRVVLLTAVERRAGVSDVAAALAVAGAANDRGQRIVLVDANLRHPRIAHVFSLHGRAGLAELMRGERTLDQCIVAVEVATSETQRRVRLSILPSGASPLREEIAPDRWAGLLAELGRRFDRVIIDAPILSEGGDRLAAAADGAVLVVPGHEAVGKSAESARERLRACGARLIGIVLNQYKS